MSNEDDIVNLRLEVVKLHERLVAADKALFIANESIKTTAHAIDKRMEDANKFRESLKDYVTTLVTRKEFETYVHFKNKIIGGLSVLVFIIPILLHLFFVRGGGN